MVRFDILDFLEKPSDRKKNSIKDRLKEAEEIIKKEKSNTHKQIIEWHLMSDLTPFEPWINLFGINAADHTCGDFLAVIDDGFDCHCFHTCPVSYSSGTGWTYLGQYTKPLHSDYVKSIVAWAEMPKYEELEDESENALDELKSENLDKILKGK